MLCFVMLGMCFQVEGGNTDIPQKEEHGPVVQASSSNLTYTHDAISPHAKLAPSTPPLDLNDSASDEPDTSAERSLSCSDVWDALQQEESNMGFSVETSAQLVRTLTGSLVEVSSPKVPCAMHILHSHSRTNLFQPKCVV